MNPTSPKDVRDWCRENGFHPSRAMGQNFLIDRNTLDAIIATSGTVAGQLVLEVGPGLGVLTRALLETGARVVAVEKDRRLAAFLRETLAPKFPGLTLIEGDMLKQDLAALFQCSMSNWECPTGNFNFHFTTCKLPVEHSLLEIEH